MIRRSPRVLSLLLVILALWPVTASAQDIDYSGNVITDTRFRFPGKEMPYEDKTAFERTDNLVQSRFVFSWRNVEAVAHLRMRYTGSFNQVNAFEDLTFRDHIDSYRFESDAMYLSIYDLFTEGLTLRLGRQVVQWGAGDQFNPTSNINPYLYDDRLEFGLPMANEMVMLEYAAPVFIEGDSITLFGNLALQGVFVPVFRPGTVPTSALLAFSSPDLIASFVNTPLLNGMVDILNAFVAGEGTVVYNVSPDLPDISAENFQAGTRLTMTVLGVDVGASYYHGFDNFPRAKVVDVDVQGLDPSVLSSVLDPNDPSNLEPIVALLTNPAIAAALPGVTVVTDTTLYYPKIDVVGADLEASLDFLDGLGLRAEFAMFFHDQETFQVAIPGADITLQEQSITDTSFWKLNAGLTYTILDGWRVDFMYLHGFVDEFGTQNLRDYVVAGTDVELLSGQLLFRVFNVIELAEAKDASAVIHPAVFFRFIQNLDLMIGALIYVGDANSKFGNPGTGANSGILRGVFSF